MRKGAVVAALAVLVLVLSARSEAAGKVIESFTCFAANMSGVGGAKSGVVLIGIERWSTDEEREMLRGTLLQKGPDALLGALQRV